MSIPAHQGELDLHLWGWIKDLLDGIPGLGDWTVVGLTGVGILAVPVGLTVFYLAQQRSGS